MLEGGFLCAFAALLFCTWQFLGCCKKGKKATSSAPVSGVAAPVQPIPAQATPAPLTPVLLSAPATPVPPTPIPPTPAPLAANPTAGTPAANAAALVVPTPQVAGTEDEQRYEDVEIGDVIFKPAAGNA